MSIWEDYSTHEEMYFRRLSFAARWASILHLVDLKRAQHSPTRTEYDIPSDGVLTRRYRPTCDTQSYLGSVSAICAEQGSGAVG